MPTAPESWENATPVFGIRYPKSNAPARKLPDAFTHIGMDLENALLTDAATPPGMVYTTGTKAARLAASPVKDQIWVETDTGDQYIGTGAAWVAIIAPVVTGVVTPRAGINISGAVHRSGRIVILDVSLSKGTDMAANELVATIPVEFAPNIQVIGGTHLSSGYGLVGTWGSADANGEIHANAPGVAGVRSVAFNLSWIK